MFQIDDDFLTSVGYDVASLSEAQKAEYIEQITNEVNERVSSRLVSELSDEQIEEFNNIQENADRARRWLDEFHADYEERKEYRQILANGASEDEAVTFYAVAFWFRDAVPGYGELIQEELDDYQARLIAMRNAANNSIS